MCYLCVLPPNVEANLEWLLNSLTSNNDGVGFTIATANGQLITEHAVGIQDVEYTEWKGKDGKLHSYNKVVVDKAPMEDLCRRFVKLRKRHIEGPAIFHSRLATGGVEDTRGCHPFKVGGMKGTVLAHNGIMFSSPQGDWRSDTRIFAEDILNKQFRKFWRQDVRDRLEQYLGLGNKIAIITVNQRFMTRVKGQLSKAKSEFFIFNEDLGHWTEDGTWHSNSSYEPFKSYRTYKSTGGGWKGHGSGTNGWDYDDEWGAYDWTGSTPAQAERDKQAESGQAYTCAYCQAYGAVDVYTEVCSICLSCNGCGDLEDNCQCYTPPSARYNNKPASTRAPDSIYCYKPDDVEPRAITAGTSMFNRDTSLDRPAIEATASPDERRAVQLKDWYVEWAESDDPAVDHMTFEAYVMLRDYETTHEVDVTFQSIDQMEDWFAEQAALASMRDDDTKWLASIEQAKDDVAAADTLLEQVDAVLDTPECDVDPDDEPGIIRRLP